MSDAASRGDGSSTADLASGGERPMSLDGIRQLYADQAEMADRFDVCNRLFSGWARRRVYRQAQGRVLDVACGNGINVRYLPAGIEYVGIDLSPAMLANAAGRYPGLDRGVNLFEMDAAHLAFPDDSFETVISALSTCTFPDPIAALNEMGRVVGPDGEVLLLEHGRSSIGPIARFQDWRAEAHYEKHGCRWTQEPLALVGASDLVVEWHRSGPLGLFTAIGASPPDGAGE